MSNFTRYFDENFICSGCGQKGISNCKCHEAEKIWGYPCKSMARRLHLFIGKQSVCGGFFEGTRAGNLDESTRYRIELRYGKCKKCLKWEAENKC